MNKNFVTSILLAATWIYGNYTIPLPNNTPSNFIANAFIDSSLSDLYATMDATNHALATIQKSHKTAKRESKLIGKQIQDIEHILLAIKPLLIDEGSVNQSLKSKILEALHEDRHAVEHKKTSINSIPWDTVAHEIGLLNKRLSSSSLDPEIGKSITKINASASLKSGTSSIAKSVIKKPELTGMKSFAIDMISMFLIMKGLGEAESLMSADDRKAQQPIIDRFKVLQDELKKKNEAFKTNIESTIESLQEAYQKSFELLHSTVTQGIEDIQKEYNYILRLINTTQSKEAPQLLNAMTLDLLFGQSAMATPQNAPKTVWHNVWNNPNGFGNWLYDPELNSFIQYGASLGSLKKNISLQSQSINKEDKTFSPYLADYNQIFTEYFSPEKSYEIKISITLIDAAFPFCCGIAFNKARWLAGSLDRDSTYRFVGIVGTLQDSDGKKTLKLNAPIKKLGIYAAQAVKNILGNITSPMVQLFDVDKKIDPLVSLDADINEIGKNPLTFTIRIINRQDYVELYIDKNGKQIYQEKLLFSNQDMNKTLFWYHGIGFIAPRCQARFTIASPEELTYQPSEINAFKKCLDEKTPQKLEACLIKG